MNITKITIGRLYNLGNYEHIRYDLTVEIKEGESATEAVTALEKIINGLKPLKTMAIQSPEELKRRAAEIERMQSMPAVEWEHHYGHAKGTPSEVIERYQRDLDADTLKYQNAQEHARTARKMFDDLGGTSQWKDAKLDWEDYNDDDYDLDQP